MTESRIDAWLDEHGDFDADADIRHAETQKTKTDDGVIGELSKQICNLLLIGDVHSVFVSENDSYLFVQFKPEEQTMPVTLQDVREFKDVVGCDEILFEVGKPGITLRYRKET